MNKVYGYIRVSSVVQTEGQSLQAQEAHIRHWFEYAKKLRPELEFGGIFEERGVSAGTNLLDRPMGRKLDNALDRGDMVVFAKLDRGFRDTRDTLWTIDVWRRRGITVRFLDIDVDSSTAAGELVLTNIAAVARFERARLGERLRESRQEAIRKGLYPMGRTPIGWTRKRSRGGDKLVPDEQARAVGRKLVEWWKGGNSFSEMTHHLEQMGVKTPAGRRWSRGAIYRLFWAAIDGYPVPAEYTTYDAQGNPLKELE